MHFHVFWLRISFLPRLNLGYLRFFATGSESKYRKCIKIGRCLQRKLSKANAFPMNWKRSWVLVNRYCWVLGCWNKSNIYCRDFVVHLWNTNQQNGKFMFLNSHLYSYKYANYYWFLKKHKPTNLQIRLISKQKTGWKQIWNILCVDSLLDTFILREKLSRILIYWNGLRVKSFG